MPFWTSLFLFFSTVEVSLGRLYRLLSAAFEIRLMFEKPGLLLISLGRFSFIF